VIEAAVPPFCLSQERWSKIGFGERAMLVAAQECDVYRSAEEPLGSLRGPRVDVYLRFARSAPGNPWDAAFVAWCCGQAGWLPSEAALAYPSSVKNWLFWAGRAKRVKTGHPARGDLFCIDRPGASHMGFVSHVIQGEIHTIEGNADPDGGRVGSQVVRRVRSALEPSSFITLRGIPVA